MNPRRKTVILGDAEFGQAASQVLPLGPSRVVACHADALPAEIERASSLAEACRDADVVILSGIAQRLVELVDAFGEYARGDHVVLLHARGVLEGFELPHQTLRKRTCIRKIGVFGGPLHAQDLASQQHVNLVLATRFPEVWRRTKEILPPRGITIGRSRDLTGVAVAGVFGHLAALLTGMGQGLGWLETPRALLVAHILEEARNLAVALGAESATFQGLVGWGELIPRASVRSDRHTLVGQAVVRGTPLARAVEEVGQTIEGIDTAREALRAGQALGVHLPLTHTLVDILDGASDPGPRLESILALPLAQ